MPGMENVCWSKFCSQSSLLIQTALGHGEVHKSAIKFIKWANEFSVQSIFFFFQRSNLASGNCLSFFKRWVRSIMKAIWAKYDQTVFSVPQILMTGLVIYDQAVALSQGRCTRISHLHTGFSLEDPWRFFFLHGCCVQPSLSCQLLALTCGVGLFQ